MGFMEMEIYRFVFVLMKIINDYNNNFNLIRFIIWMLKLILIVLC